MNILHSFSHTDLALELKDELEESCEREQFFEGITVSHNEIGEKGLKETVIKIESEAGEKQLGKPQGIYITLEGENMAGNDGGFHEEMSNHLAKRLAKLLLGRKKLLFIGLGNGEVTPDALGPYVVDQLNVTRHIVQEYGRYAVGKGGSRIVSAIVPGVMAQTGMESAEIIRGIVNETTPDLIMVIDALAARSTKRLNRTIQISDAGIYPGAGVGNHRSEITKDTMGIPVIAIGVPTVVDAATIVNDTMENFITALETSETLKGVGVVLQGYNSAEKYELVKELIAPHLNGMFVTPKDIDDTVRRISYTISEAMNMLFAGKEKIMQS